MSLRTRKAMALLATSALMLGAAACSSERTTDGDGGDTAATDGGGEAGGLIGIAMPTRSLERWNNDGANLEAKLQEMGYDTSLQYADNEVDQQINQIQTMLNQDPEVLVIAAIDGTALTPVLEAAENQGVDVIAYDRLINDSEAVDYYATFDNYGVGQMQGEFIVEQLGLENGEEGPFTLEPFAGSPDDNNARFFFAGAWDVLLPYVESGQLVVPSGKAPASVDEWTTIGIQGWESDTAQSEMENRLNSFYAGGEKVDVVLSPNDSLALGIEQALDANGYTPGENWPVITGQDADLANVNNMLAGMQSMTVWKDTRTLGEQVATMVDQIVTGEEVEVNDTETYDNGVKVVPSYLLPPEVVTPDTVEDKLVGSGFYDAGELDL